MGERAADELRYRAFLSYSHKDAAAAGRLHRRLETYRMPRRLVGTETARGIVPARLWPIFRDREELPAATDLSETVREALAQSGALIILCSPHAAGSLWVAEEIETFRTLHPDRPILAAVLDDDPPDCFPAALRALGSDGSLHEPLATDLRPQCDGPRLGLLKLVAGITGVGLDALVQRDAARRIRRVMAVTGAALVAMLIMAALALVAVNARSEAERQRTEAKGLADFMLNDLREKLKGVGRLDIMTAVNERALGFYDRQLLLRGLPSDALMRARTLLAIGEDNLTRGNERVARGAFREAHQATQRLLDQSPNEPDRIFAHSQSEYWIGYLAYGRRDYAAARRAWDRYKALADRLVALDGRNANWLKEAAFAEGNLCTVAREGEHDIPTALANCFTALARMEASARASGNIGEYRRDLANRHAEIADTLTLAGRVPEALEHQGRRLRLLGEQLAVDPANTQLRARLVWAQRGTAHLEARLGRFGAAVTHMAEALRGLEALVLFEPNNSVWEQELVKIRTELAQIRQGRRQ